MPELSLNRECVLQSAIGNRQSEMSEIGGSAFFSAFVLASTRSTTQRCGVDNLSAHAALFLAPDPSRRNSVSFALVV